MSVELVNRITIKKDGVYISSHSANDSRPFHSWRCSGLSEVYASEGQKGLDREIIRMLFEYATLRGSHKSLDRYRYAVSEPRSSAIRKKYIDQVNDRFEKLSEEEANSFWRGGPDMCEKAREYRDFQREMHDKMYSEIAELCSEYDQKQQSNNIDTMK